MSYKPRTIKLTKDAFRAKHLKCLENETVSEAEAREIIPPRERKTTSSYWVDRKRGVMPYSSMATTHICNALLCCRKSLLFEKGRGLNAVQGLREELLERDFLNRLLEELRSLVANSEAYMALIQGIILWEKLLLPLEDVRPCWHYLKSYDRDVALWCAYACVPEEKELLQDVVYYLKQNS